MALSYSVSNGVELNYGLERWDRHDGAEAAMK